MPDLETLEARKYEAEIREITANAEKAEMELKLIRGQDAAHGEFELIGQVQEASVHNLIDRLAVFSRLHPGAPLTVTINSEGGNVFDGNALFDYLRRLSKRGHHITTVGLGMVASMGGILLQAGDTRVMTPRAWLLLHEVQTMSSGPRSTTEVDDGLKLTKRLQEQALDALAERSTKSREWIKKNWKRRDFTLSSKDALDAGFIDSIEEL